MLRLDEPVLGELVLDARPEVAAIALVIGRPGALVVVELWTDEELNAGANILADEVEVVEVFELEIDELLDLVGAMTLNSVDTVMLDVVSC
jgi:hypothetical protein